MASICLKCSESKKCKYAIENDNFEVCEDFIDRRFGCKCKCERDKVIRSGRY